MHESHGSSRRVGVVVGARFNYVIHDLGGTHVL